MADRKLQAFEEYRYGLRGVLVPGDRFRGSGGPVYVTDEGQIIPMYERGEFRFLRLCVRGASKWIEARQADRGGIAILWVGKPSRSPAVPNLRRKPYKISKVRGG